MNYLDNSQFKCLIDSIITKDLIDKINSFFCQYNINKNCADIWDNIEIISETQCIGKYKDMVSHSGKYDTKTRKIILIDSKITQRLFLHEYIHKKSAKHRFLRKDLLGISYNRHFALLNEAITEKITCEILCIPKNEQMFHPYFSMFIAVDELAKLISWEEIVQSYFGNDISIYKNALGKDLNLFLDKVSTLYVTYPLLFPNDATKKMIYQFTYNDIVNLITNHIG